MPSARKDLKRTDLALVLAVKDTVGKVFIWKQTSVMYENAKFNDDGELTGFDLRQLYDVVRQVHITREIALFAWVLALENSVGTSMMGLNAMTAMADAFDFNFSDLLREAVDENGKFDPVTWQGQRLHEERALQPLPEARPLRAEPRSDGRVAEAREGGRRSAPRAARGGRRVPLPLQPVGGGKPGHDRRLRHRRALGAPGSDGAQQVAARRADGGDGGRRHRGATGAAAGRAAGIAGGAGKPRGGGDGGGSVGSPPASASLLATPAGRGARLWAEQGAEPSPGDAAAYAWSTTRRGQSSIPAAANCAMCNADGSKKKAYHSMQHKTCPYCYAPTTMPYSVSAVAPDIVQASLFYRPSAMLNWAQGNAHEVGASAGLDFGSNPYAGTRPTRRYAEHGSGDNGNKRYNFAWVVLPHLVDGEGKQRKMESFSKLARDIRFAGRSRQL